MVNDNYWSMKEILILKSSQIIYDHMEVIQHEDMFVYLFIYSFFNT